jgi:anti-anti-sigma factor
VKHLDIQTRNRTTIIRPREDLGGGDETDAVVTQVRRAIEGGASCVMLDLTRVGFINSLALGAIIGCHVHASTRSAKLLLCNPDDRVRKILEITKLDTVLDRCDSIEVALANEAAEGGSSTSG